MDEIEKLTRRIVKAILDDVTDRRGWRQEWDQFDDDVKREIIEDQREIVRKLLRNAKV